MGFVPIETLRSILYKYSQVSCKWSFLARQLGFLIITIATLCQPAAWDLRIARARASRSPRLPISLSPYLPIPPSPKRSPTGFSRRYADLFEIAASPYLPIPEAHRYADLCEIASLVSRSRSARSLRTKVL